MAASRVQAGPDVFSTPAAAPVDRNPHRRRETPEVETHRTAPGVATEEQKYEVIIYANPLDQSSQKDAKHTGSEQSRSPCFA